MPQDVEGIDAGVVAVAPSDTQAVPTHRFDILNGDQHGNASGFDPKLSGPFIRAGGAGAMLAQIADGINPLVAVAPFDAEDAVFNPVHVLRLDVAHNLGSIRYSP